MKNITIVLNGYTLKYSIVICGQHLSTTSESAERLFKELIKEVPHGTVKPEFGTDEFTTEHIYWKF